LPECARLSGNSDESLDDRDLQRALEDSSRDAKKQRQQHGKNQIKLSFFDFSIPSSFCYLKENLSFAIYNYIKKKVTYMKNCCWKHTKFYVFFSLTKNLFFFCNLSLMNIVVEMFQTGKVVVIKAC